MLLMFYCYWCCYIDDQRRGAYVLCMYSAIVHDWDNLCWICVYYSKFLHNDNGKEYTSNEFENYHLQHGIKHKTTMPYNPQHNGVSKRMNGTILNMVCSMLFFKNVKLMFWVYVALCAVYIKNRCPSNGLRKKTPYEMLYDRMRENRWNIFEGFIIKLKYF